MKILMVTMKMGIGGAETHIFELCRELYHMGHQITLASNGGVYADRLVDIGITHVKLPLDRKNPEAVAASMSGLARLIKHGGFDLVHAHARIPAFICGILWKKYKFRFVTTAHLNFSINPLWRRLSNWGERSMAVSDDIADYLVNEYGYPRDKISVTINGIDTEANSPDTPYDDILEEFNLSASAERNRLVYVSRLDADRADPAYRIVKIAAELDRKIPKLDIIIGGGGTEFNKIKHMADEVNKKAGRNLVTMTNNRSDINKLTACATVFVGVSRSALEAMASGKPVIIAGNQGSLGIFNESVLSAAMDTNFCCRGFPKADEASLLRDITQLFGESREQLKQRGEWCRSVVMKYYTSERMTQDYIEMYENTLKSPVPFNGYADVVISGYYGFGNMGDETLLDIISESLAAEKNGVKIAALTRHPKRDRLKKGVKCIGRMNIFGIARELSHAKLLISGGGTLFQDGTSKRSLMYYAGIIALAKRMGTKVYIYANGVGPISNERNKKIAAVRTAEADFVSVRDPDSKDELAALGINNVEVTADPAFLTDMYTGGRLEKSLAKRGLSSDTPFFAVSLRRCEGKLALLIDEERLIEETARACAVISKRYSLRPLLIPMQPQNDEEICRRTAERINALLSKGGAVTEDMSAAVIEPETAAEFTGILSLAKFVIGMRLHMLIFAGRACVPVIGLSYDPKIDSIMKRLEQPYILSVTSLMADEIIDSAADIMERRDEICSTVRRHASEMAEMCISDIKKAASLL